MANQPLKMFVLAALLLASTNCVGLGQTATAAPARPLAPKVEVEEEVYKYEPANNGAGPMWCSGLTCLVRIGDDVFASGLETLKIAKPLNNCRWTLWKRNSAGWQLQLADEKGRTREPSPVGAFPDGKLLVSANPTLSTAESGGGPALPEILSFNTKGNLSEFERLLPVWDGNPEFTEHSYRSLAVDGANREVILFQNIGYTHAEWSYLGRDGKWSAQGRLPWPEGKEYPKPEPIRVCYPDLAIANRQVHFCGVSDIIEPYPEWRAFKRELTGQEWDYDFRRLFYTWTPDVTREPFRPWIEIASRDKTCGWISPGDLWVAPDGTVSIMWSERALDERLRTKFYPDVRQRHSIEYASLRDGKIQDRRTLVASEEGSGKPIPSAPRFHISREGRLFVVFYVNGSDQSGHSVSENRVLEISRTGSVLIQAAIPLQHPFTSYFTATVRAGSPPSDTIDMLGECAGIPSTIRYARIRLW